MLKSFKAEVLQLNPSNAVSQPVGSGVDAMLLALTTPRGRVVVKYPGRVRGSHAVERR